MERSRWYGVLLLLIVFLLGGLSESEGCLADEKIALLELKPFFPHINGWDIEYENCCDWERVECNSTSGRVIQLFLNFTATITEDDHIKSLNYVDVGPVFPNTRYEVSNYLNRDPIYYNVAYYGERKLITDLNASLFLPFEELKGLYLSGNSISSCIHGEGFERLSSKLNKLEILDLSSNHLNESILFSLSELSSLKFLYLGKNGFTESNAMNGIKGIAKLKNLEVLDLHENILGNDVIFHLYAFKSLKILYLQGCGLNETIQMAEFSKMTNLKELYLGDNQIESLSFYQGQQEVELLKLEVLVLSGNRGLNNSVLESFGALPNLKRLYIRRNNLKGSIVLNALSNLEELYMSSNQLTDIVPSQENETKLEFVNLKVLDFTDNSCNNSILTFLRVFPNLKSLSIGWMNLQGTLDLGELRDLNNLEELQITCWNNRDSNGSLVSACSFSHQSWDVFSSLKTLYLDGFNLNGTYSSPFHLNNSESLGSNFLQHIAQIPSLKSLTLWECENILLHNYGPLHWKNLESIEIKDTPLDYSILQSIAATPSLKFISLIGCGLSGTLPTTGGICELKHLARLDMAHNDLKGNLQCLSNFRSLEHLDLSDNQLSGNISFLKSLTFLEYLDLSNNQLSGNISSLKSLTSLQHLILSNNYLNIPSSLGPLFNFSKLKSFIAQNNIIYTETEMSSLSPSFQLNFISLSCCGEVGSFPIFLYYQHDLSIVDLSNINLTGEFPNWLLDNNTRLRKLFLANNSLMGHFELPFLSHSVLLDLDISKNSFDGKIPTEIGAKFPYLRSLNMSKNCFAGGIPPSIGDTKYLTLLDLSNNALTGGIPEALAAGCSQLRTLVLSNNNLQGQIFHSNFSMEFIQVLQLDGNHFSGTIPPCLSSCLSLSTLIVSNNSLSGEIPRSLGSLSRLQEIDMANNHFEGPFPAEFCQLNLNLRRLDLSRNNISGSIPSCFSPSLISTVHLSRNKLQGPLNDAFRNSTVLVTLDLSSNHLSGTIPNWIGKLSQLSYLLLKDNHFEGGIPIELCNLDDLRLIDLSNNNLTGTIPPCLKIKTINDSVFQDYDQYLADVAQATSSFASSEPIQFTTKNNSYPYKGRVLGLMSGIDLSCNKLTGEIPRQVQNFQKILGLNLSHNCLTGTIPPEFSNFSQIESLDLSYNDLSGYIPPQLVRLNFLAYFNVSYNNLSGKTPERVAQFGTFNESSYFGNLFLCGDPLPKCKNNSSSSTPTVNGEGNSLIDMDAFYVTFGVAYVVVLLSIGAVLYINPYWRRIWFYHVENITTSCYYFVLDNILSQIFRCRNM